MRSIFLYYFSQKYWVSDQYFFFICKPGNIWPKWFFAIPPPYTMNFSVPSTLRFQVYAVVYQIFRFTISEFYQCVRLPNGPLIFLSTTLLNVLEKHWYSKGSPLQLSNSTSDAPCCGSRLQIMSVTLFWTSSRFLWPLLLSVAETIKNLSEFGYL